MNETLASALLSSVSIMMLVTVKLYSAFIDSKPAGRKTVLSKYIDEQNFSKLRFSVEATISVWRVKIAGYGCVLVAFVFLLRIGFGPLPYYLVIACYYSLRKIF